MSVGVCAYQCVYVCGVCLDKVSQDRGCKGIIGFLVTHPSMFLNCPKLKHGKYMMNIEILYFIIYSGAEICSYFFGDFEPRCSYKIVFIKSSG